MSELFREYVTPILSDNANEPLLCAAEAWDRTRPSEVPSLQALWKEWYPLRGALLPVAAGYSEDPWVIPCVSLAAQPDYPVFLWDFLADLGSQLDKPIVKSFTEWCQLKKEHQDNLLTDAVSRLRDRQQAVDAGRQETLQLFQRIAHDFARHNGGYDHERGGMLPRPKLWRPIRVACKDVLLAVCAIRFNRNLLTLDICAWAAADHTMFAKGSGTRNALELVLADATKCGAVKGIRFLKDDSLSAHTVPPSRDVVVLARVLGMPDCENGMVTGSALNRLERFLAAASARFPAVEVQGSWAERPAAVLGLAERELLHLVRKGIWSAEEVVAITAHCPMATEALRGRIDPQRNGMIFDLVWAHLRTASLAELTVRALIGSGEADGRPILDEEPQPTEFTQHELPGYPYGRLLRYRGDAVTVSFRMLARDGTIECVTRPLRLGDELRLVPVALPAHLLSEYFNNITGKPVSDDVSPKEMIVVSADVQKLPLGDRQKLVQCLQPFRLMVCESDLFTIDEEILVSVRSACRLGSAATLAAQPPTNAQAVPSPIEVYVRDLQPKHSEERAVLDQLMLLLDRLERGLDVDRSRQAAARLLALRAAQISGGELRVVPARDIEGPRILNQDQSRRIVLGIRSWQQGGPAVEGGPA